MLKRISWQAIFTHSSGAAAATIDASGQMDTTKDASVGASFDGARRASTSISVARPSIDSSLSTSTTTSTAPLTASSNVAKQNSPRSSPPPSYLLDDDPFANLIPMTGGTRHRPSFSVGSTSSCIPRSQRPPPIHPELVPGLSLPAMPVGVPAPKSRLQDSLEFGAQDSDKVRRARSQDGQKEAKGKKEESKRKRAKTFFVTMSAPVSPSKSHFSSKIPVPPLPTNSETMSLPPSPKLPSMFNAPPPTTNAFGMTRIQPRPAHQRPAFATRPSLPSLDTLAKTNVVLTKKVKKGRVGAGLPFEPWDNLPEDDEQPYNAPYMPATLTTPPISAKIPMKTEHLYSIPDIDRTPTSTPVSAAPASPTRSSFSSTLSSAISTRSVLTTPPPQPYQTVALGPLIEDIETDIQSPLLWSPSQLTPSTSKPDAAVSTPVSSITNVSINLESQPLAAPVALLPSVPGASILKNLEAGNGHSTDSDRNSMEVADDENGYFNGDLLDTYGISYTPEPEPEFERHWTTDKSDDPEASANKDAQLRWSVATHDSNIESQPHSPSSSNSYAGSISDLSSAPSYPPSYSFGYGGGWSRDSMTDVSQHLSLSRSVSSTSISTSSIGDDIESNINFNHSRSRSANTSDSSQGADLSQSAYDHHPLLRSSALIVSGNNSILHSPDSEWTFFNQKRIQFPDVLVGPPLQKRPILPQVQGRIDSEPESELPFISGLGDSEDAQETIGRQQNSHAVAHDIFDESLATADDPIPAYSDSAPVVALVLKHDQESRLSLVEPAFPLATPSDQDTHQPILAETFRSGSPLSTLNPSDHLHLETEPEELNEMNGIDRQLREKMAHSGEHFLSKYVEGPPALSSNFVSAAPRRDIRSSEGEERRRRMKLLQVWNGGHGLQSAGDDKATKNHRTTDVVPISGAGILRTTSSVTVSSKPQQFPSSLSISSASEGEVSSDDDIPLAQRIPGALTAQQSIRKQVDEEREARRVARDKRRRERQVTLRPAGAGYGGVESTALPSSQDLHTATSSSNPTVGSDLTATGSIRQRSGSVHHRQKTQVMPNMPLGTQGDFVQAFRPEDLARKLQNVKLMGESPAVSIMRSQHQQTQGQLNKLSRSVSSASRPSLDYSQHPIPASSVSPVPRLKSQRSFHVAEMEHQSRDLVAPQDHLPPRKRSMSMSRGDSRRGPEDSVPPLPNTILHGRTNLDDRDRNRRGLVKSHADSKVTPPERLQSNQDIPIGGVEGVVTSKLRVFIHSLQLSHPVDIRTDTSAGDLISSLEEEGVLDGWAGLGGWMVWEIAQDFGMERPVRSYELLSDVQASWMTEKTVNFFLLKKTLLSSTLDRLAIPSSAPRHSAWIEWEAKRGKWSKRWLLLKENCLYISKKDGREETLLCSLSNFDAYYITRSHRSPKPFSFTIKSTDKLSFFENAADYMHTFSCSQKDGDTWMEKILVARSYVLHQERSALFHPKVPNNVINTGSTLSRAGTKKTTVSKLHQPLVNLASDKIFEPGSLLSKK